MHEMPKELFNSLPEAAHDVLFWLAINGGEASFEDLRVDLVPCPTEEMLLETLHQLHQRSIVAITRPGNYILQPETTKDTHGNKVYRREQM